MAKTILVVDDSPTDLHLMTSMLDGKGYSIITAIDGEGAMEKTAKNHPDLILLDVVLPQKNGFQICRELKTSPNTKNIKIVLVTGKSQETDRLWGMKQGADAYITKPFKKEELLDTVSKFI